MPDMRFGLLLAGKRFVQARIPGWKRMRQRWSKIRQKQGETELQ
jgi:hypothetical protein